MNKRLTLVVFLFASALCTSGCWDQIQIEERGFVIGVALDKPKSREAEKSAEAEAPGRSKGKHRVVATQQFVIPGGITGIGNKGGGASSPDQAFLNLTSEGDSLLEISRTMATRTSRSPFYQHMKLIIVSEQIAKTKGLFADVLDFFLRDPDSRRSVKVIIAKGEAKGVIEVTPKNERLPVMYINSVSENVEKSGRMLPKSRIGEVHEYLLKSTSFVLPRITANENEVKVAGAAVFHGADNLMVGYLGEEETEGLNFLTGTIKGGMLKIPVHDNMVSFNIRGAKRKISAHIDDKEHIRFDIMIQCEGNVAESFERLDFSDSKIVKGIQEKLSREIERMAYDCIEKVQKEMNTDVLELGRYLNKKHKSFWAQVKNDWEHGHRYFAKSEIQVHANVYMRNFGEVIKSEQIERR
ncbi:Ger(x)C family spore germination protein [Paenibacillus sp. MBLB4367]|uniref:Ger(x)C family spore germination protein n=1 Tax=Paenibacillus sp. MBLB4367 TaxID=3384767 RepID=UPI003907F32D